MEGSEEVERELGCPPEESKKTESGDLGSPPEESEKTGSGDTTDVAQVGVGGSGGKWYAQDDEQSAAKPKSLQILLETKAKPETSAEDAILHALDFVYFSVSNDFQRVLPSVAAQRLEEEEMRKQSLLHACTFDSPLGITLGEEVDDQGDSYVYVDEIDSDGVAFEKYKEEIIVGARVTKVGDTPVQGYSFAYVHEMIREAERPVTIEFKHPSKAETEAVRDTFRSFGAETVQFFRTIGATSPEPIKTRALVLLEQVSNKWQSEYEEMAHNGMFMEDAASILKDVYCFEQIGRKPVGKEELMVYLSSDYNELDSAEDWFKFDPAHPVQLSPVNGHLLLRDALLMTYFADSADVVIAGTSYLDLLKLLPRLRPYQEEPLREKTDEDGEGSSSETSITLFEDQCALIFTVVQTLSHFGELCLSPTLFPEEYAFLRRKDTMTKALNSRNIHAISQIITCLRIFCVSEDDKVLKRGCAELLQTQLADGSWVPEDISNAMNVEEAKSDEELAEYFFGTTAVCKALCPSVFRGFGPGISGSLAVLKSKDWLPKLRRNKHDFERVYSVHGASVTNLKHLRPVLDAYPKAKNYRESLMVSVKRRAELRLDALLNFKQKKTKMHSKQWNTYKLSGGYQNMRGLGLAVDVYKKHCRSIFKTLKSIHSFLRKLEKFHRESNQANVNQILKAIDFDEGVVDVGGDDLNLFLLFKRVLEQGGVYKEHEDSWWTAQAKHLELPRLVNRGNTLRRTYARFLEGFERSLVSAAVGRSSK